MNSLIYKLRNSSVKSYPFPHFYAKNVFRSDTYQKILATLPEDSSFKQGAADYHGRRFADPTQNPLFKFMLSDEFKFHIAMIFGRQIQIRFPAGDLSVTSDLRLVRDKEAYEIGPHTDTPRKIVSLLFYLPKNYEFRELGTSIFVPKDPDYTDPLGKHHDFTAFNKIFTAPYLPNSCFGFFRTDNSFHGVEPITIPVTRDVLLYNLYDATH